MELITSLLILFILILLGLSSRYFAILKKGDVQVLTTFVYYFSLPALFVVKISALNIFQIDPVILIGSYVPIFIVLLLIWMANAFRWLKHDTALILAITVVFGNNSFFGLAFFEFFKDGAYFEYAVITAGALGALGIVLSLILFEIAENALQPRLILRKLLVNPLILSIIGGSILSIMGFKESFLHSSFEILGNAAPSIAVFSLGIFLYDHFSIDFLKKSYIFALFRMISLPIAFIIFLFVASKFTSLSLNFGLSQFLLLQTGLPAAASLVIFAQKYNFKVQEITGVITLTSVGSFLALATLYLLSLLYSF